MAGSTQRGRGAVSRSVTDTVTMPRDNRESRKTSGVVGADFMQSLSGRSVRVGFSTGAKNESLLAAGTDINH